MAITGHCGIKCGECTTRCELDECIPCSPDCENLTPDGKINIKKCLEHKCEDIRYIFDALDLSDEEIIQRYGEVTTYPY